MKKILTIVSCVALLVAATTASAAISAADADRLGKDLTPVGAEKAGNADGTIPAWEGGITEAFSGWKSPDGDRPNPFAEDKVLFTITAENMAQYVDKLPDAAQAMLKAYPADFKMNVYPTHRSAAYPQWYYDNIKKNATTAEMIDDGNGIAGSKASIPFPIPQNGREVVWNHIVRFQGKVKQTDEANELVRYSNGKLLLWSLNNTINYPFYAADASDDDAQVYLKYNSTGLKPSSDSGAGTLAHDSTRPGKNPRKAWTYDPGERRVRRAPNLAFDTPDRPINVVDDFDNFSGSPEKYDFKLIGKQEMYVPYNNNDLNSIKHSVDEVFPVPFVKSDLVRYELHRVWVVEATVASGQRHIYAKRTMYIDEDTWTILASGKYDKNGNMWRTSFYYPVTAPEIPVTAGGFNTTSDLKKNAYYPIFSVTGNKKSYNFLDEPKKASFFTPAAVRRRGR